MSGFDISTASPDEIRAEAERRKSRRAQGLPMHETPTEKTERIKESDERAEIAIQANCKKLYMAYGCDVFSTSQYRKAKVSPGLPDLIVFHKRAKTAWFHETKTSSGEQSSAQEYFEECAVAAQWRYVYGGTAAAEDQLIRIGIAERQPDGSLDLKR